MLEILLAVVLFVLLLFVLAPLLLLCAAVGWLVATVMQLRAVQDMDNAKLRGQADALQERLATAETELAVLTKEKGERDDGDDWKHR